MKKTACFFLLLLAMLSGTVNAQDLDLKWSEKFIYDNKKDGFFENFIDANSKYVYGRFTNLAMRESKKEKKMKLVAFDKTTMKKVADVALVGFKENEASKEKYKGLDYYKTIIFENLVYVFWRKEDKGKEELYVQSFDSKLKAVNKLKKIYEIQNADSKRARRNQSIFVMANRKAGEKIIIGGEPPVAAGQDVKFEYKVLNSDFTFATANQATLPVTLTSKSYGLTSSYEFGDDGNLYVKSYVSMDKDERKNARKGEATSFAIFSMIDLNTAAVTPYTMKFDGKNIFDFGYTIDKNTVKVYGFFSDLEKDPYGSDTHGIYYALLDSKSFTMKDMNFAYFDKQTLEKLFANDKEDKKRSGVFTSKKKKQSAGESLDSRFEIENVQSIDNNIVLFCSKMYNYSVTTCTSTGNGGSTCTTNYYCEKSNVTAFKLTNEGDLVWASNLDRKITYNRWFVEDLRVINRNDKFYVMYGSSFQTNAKKKNFSSRKSKKQRQDKFEYAVFDYSTGNYKKNEFTVNTINAKDKKFVDPQAVTVIDNNFYVDSEKTKLKAGPTVAVCAGALVCPPLLYILFVNGNIKKGTGNLGVITPLK